MIIWCNKCKVKGYDPEILPFFHKMKERGLNDDGLCRVCLKKKMGSKILLEDTTMKGVYDRSEPIESRWEILDL